MSDLFVTTHTPTLDSGRAQRTYGVVRALASLGPVDLLYVRFGATAPSGEYLALPGITLHEVRPSRGLRRALGFAAACATVPPPFARGLSPELTATAAALVRAAAPRRMIADGPTAAVAATRVGSPRPALVYNAHNLESGFRAASGERGFGPPRWLERFERRLIQGVDESWMVSDLDVAHARRLAPGANVRYAPNVVDVDAIRPVWNGPGQHRLALVADFTYRPNREALRFMREAILPRVWQELPDARLALVGRGLEGERAPDPRIELCGFVPSVREIYERTDCVVVPLLNGGGSPVKFVEALAHARPVVATPHAARGMRATPGEHFLQASTPEAFAAAVLGVLRQGPGSLPASARALAEEHYSIQAQAVRLSV